MKIAKTLLILSVAFIAHASHANEISTMEKSLRPWQPLEIKKNQDAITVTLNENMITPQIYEAVSMSGICPDVWSNSASYLKTIKEVHILNKHKAAGYVFENPESVCNELGKATSDKAKIILMSNTHMF